MTTTEIAPLGDILDASAFAFAAVMREAVASGKISDADASALMDRMGEVMDHLLSGKEINAGRAANGSFTLELLD